MGNTTPRYPRSPRGACASGGRVGRRILRLRRDRPREQNTTPPFSQSSLSSLSSPLFFLPSPITHSFLIAGRRRFFVVGEEDSVLWTHVRVHVKWDGIAPL